MINHCTVLVEHLRNGSSIPIEEAFHPKNLELEGEDLSFVAPIHVKGSGYLAEDLIVIQLDIEGAFYLPCAVCNQPVKMPLVLKNTYITKPLSECSGGKFYFLQDLREAILLEIPSFAECKSGKCPERAHVEKYLKQHAPKTLRQEEHPLAENDLYYPFDGLDQELKNN